MSNVSIYLAGPILGTTKAEANEWREKFRSRLHTIDIEGVSPLRCEPLIGERYMVGSLDPRFGQGKVIHAKNKLDVRRCDMTMVYLPKFAKDDYGISIGSIIEIAWADAFGKPVMIVSDDTTLKKHPVLEGCWDWWLDNFDDAYDTIAGLFSIYR